MLGPELAALLAPFAKWGAVVAGGLILVLLGRFWVRQGAQAQEELESVSEAIEERRDATDDLRRTRRRLRAAWRRVRDRQGS